MKRIILFENPYYYPGDICSSCVGRVSDLAEAQAYVSLQMHTVPDFVGNYFVDALDVVTGLIYSTINYSDDNKGRNDGKLRLCSEQPLKGNDHGI
jgi:hypothetical protein